MDSTIFFGDCRLATFSQELRSLCHSSHVKLVSQIYILKLKNSPCNVYVLCLFFSGTVKRRQFLAGWLGLALTTKEQRGPCTYVVSEFV